MVKRILSMVLMVMLFTGMVCGASAAQRSDLAKVTADFCKDMLITLCDRYDVFGSLLDDDYVELTYRYYMAWSAMQRLYVKELQFNIKEMAINQVFGIDKNTDVGYAIIDKMITKYWEQYRDGEIEKKDFMDTLTSTIRVMINAEEKVNQGS